jgi:hypothetical protein
VSLRIKLEGAWERLEHAARLLSGDVFADRAAVAKAIAALPVLSKLRDKDTELDALIARIESVPEALGFGSLAELRGALEEDVIAEAQSAGWKAMLGAGRFVLTRSRLWWLPKKKPARSWPSNAFDPREIPELGRVPLAELHRMQALAEVHATALFRGATLGEPDRSRVLTEATRRGRGGDVVLMDDAVVFLPQSRGVWSLATKHESDWLSPVEVTVLIHELLKLPKKDADAALWRAAQHEDAFVVPAHKLADHHFVDAGNAWFGDVDDGVWVRMTPAECAVLVERLGAWGVGEPRPRVQYLREWQRRAASGESPQARSAGLHQGPTPKVTVLADRRPDTRRFALQKDIDGVDRELQRLTKQAASLADKVQGLKDRLHKRESERAALKLELQSLTKRRDAMISLRDKLPR